jgi:2,4-dichlorophenol 6-monooxygenase
MVSVAFEPLPSADPRFLVPPPTSISVLIVGAGPTGLLASYILAKLGVSSAIVERHALRLGQPKAHAINPRSLEILRHVGLDTTELRRKGTSADDGGWVRFVSTLQGTSIGDLHTRDRTRL